MVAGANPNSVNTVPPVVQRKVVIGVYLRSLNLTLSFVLFSLSVQICPLLGEHGILRASDVLEEVRHTVPGTVLDRFVLFPSLCWFVGTSDAALLFLTLGGGCLSLLACAVGGRVAKLLSMTGAFALLSIIVVGGDFCQFPWDFLLIEALFLSWFLPTTKPLFGRDGGWGAQEEPTSAALLSTHFLLFRFMWAMGVEKIPFLNQEKEWYAMTYLKRFYETEQPLPTAASWVLTKLPMWFHKLSVVGTWFIELVVPVMIFGGSEWQYWSAYLQCTLMIAIQVAGNYATFQVITCVLMIPLLTDPGSVEAEDGATRASRGDPAKPVHSPASPYVASLLLVHGGLGLLFLLHIFEPGGLSYLGNANWMYQQSSVTQSYIPDAVVYTMRALHPWRIVNQYGGIFHDTFDHEGHVALVFRGSHDGVQWKEYPLAFSIQNETSFPQFFAPWMPRLDHAAFYEGTNVQFHHIQPSNPFCNGGNAWLLQLVGLILEGDRGEVVNKLFATNPFPLRPPRFVSVISRSYKFDTWKALKEKGAWLKQIWKRQHLHTVENCAFAAEAYGRESEEYRQCMRKNCRAVLTYLNIEYSPLIHDDCALPNLSKNSMQSLWNTSHLGPEIAVSTLPRAYRETVHRWAAATMINRGGQLDKGEKKLTPFASAVHDIFEDEIVVDATVKKYVLQLGASGQNISSDLHNCLLNMLYMFRVSDTNGDKRLDTVEMARMLHAAGHMNPEEDVNEYFRVIQRSKGGTTYGRKSTLEWITFSDLVGSERLVEVACEELA